MADENAPELGSVFEFSQDISLAEAPPPLPAREYVGTVTGAVAKLNKNGGTYGAIEFTITPDQFPPDYSAIQSDAIKLYYRFVPLTDDVRSRYILKKFCEAIRVPVNRKVDLNDFMGKMGRLVVTSQQYNGETQANIKEVKMV